MVRCPSTPFACSARDRFVGHGDVPILLVSRGQHCRSGRSPRVSGPLARARQGRTRRRSRPVAPGRGLRACRGSGSRASSCAGLIRDLIAGQHPPAVDVVDEGAAGRVCWTVPIDDRDGHLIGLVARWVSYGDPVRRPNGGHRSDVRDATRRECRRRADSRPCGACIETWRIGPSGAVRACWQEVTDHGAAHQRHHPRSL